MRTRFSALGAAVAAMSVATAASAGVVTMVGGQTSVLLDLELLAAAANLQLTGVSDAVIVPGNLGESSVAFVITPPTSAVLPTTFAYDPTDFLGTANGAINHRGSITFNDSITLGNFQIAFGVDGLEVIDTLGTFGELPTALFDLAITTISPGAVIFDATAELLVSAAFAAILLDLELATSDLTGAVVGLARVQGFMIPAPGAIALLAVAGAIGTRRRRG